VAELSSFAIDERERELAFGSLDRKKVRERVMNEELLLLALCVVFIYLYWNWNVTLL
jgi:hypothetical protein